MISSPDRIPRWFATSLLTLLTGLLAYSVVGLLLAMAGWFRPLPVLGISGVVTGLAAWRLIPRLSGGAHAGREDHLVAGLVLVGVIATGAWNVDHHAEHLIVDRDPGVYLTTARWLVAEGNLRIEDLEGPFAASAEVIPAGGGFSPDDGKLAPQFPHLFPVVLAAPGWLDPGLLVVVNPILGSLALMCVFAAASTLMRPIWAASATGLLALSFPFTYMARDALSEPLAATLLFGGLWVLASARGRPEMAAVGGALVGATVMVRIDGFVWLVPLVALLGSLARRPESEDPARDRWWVTLALAGAASTAALGLVETHLFSPVYFRTEFTPRLPVLVGASVLAGMAGAVVAPTLWGHTSDDPRRRRRRVALGATTATGLLGVFTWMATVRPGEPDLPELAVDTGLPVLSLLDELDDLSYRWLEWYLGRPTTAAAVLALIALFTSTLLRHPRRIELVLPGVVLASTLLFLLSPNITPDHPWAMRRFTAVTIPGLLLALGWGVDRVWRWRPKPAPWVPPTAAVALLVVSVISIGQVTRPLRDTEVQAGSLDLVRQVCDYLDGSPSALLIAPQANLQIMLPQPVEAWCGVPVAGAASGLSASDIRSLADRWEDLGRRLVLLTAGDAPTFDLREEQVETLVATGLRAPEATLTRVPRQLVPDDRLVLGPGGDLRLRLSTIPPSG